MALCAKIKGIPLKKTTSGLQSHQERFSENEGKAALKNTDSYIDVSQTKYNELMFKSDELNGLSVKKFVSDEFEKVNEKRKEMGLRGFRPDSNTIGMGNFQISDDSLEKLGYDKSKKWNEQTAQARSNVKAVYKGMVKNAVRKPDIYGKVLTATLHVDESSPHVDFLTTGVDANRPEWSLREVLNGKEWRDETGKRRFPAKGSKLRAMQDDLNTIFTEETQKNFDLTRGKTKSERIDFARKTRKAHKQLDQRETSLDDREADLKQREADLKQREADLTRQVSESLIEARRELKEISEEKDRIEQENARKRAENAQLDGMILDNKDKAILKYMKETVSKNVPGKTVFEVVDGNRQKAEDDKLLRRLDNALSGISSKQNQGYGLER
ncbi:plasmid recombination protein [Streptococcus suis]|uniref:plasmid recombination protein n=1 Tax=Streptococcus suis TaxID=1307 RepID=UPI000CF567BC|nr:plasmid recombination protein [Streptococcus suis]